MGSHLSKWSQLFMLMPVWALLAAAAVIVFLNLALKPKDRYILPIFAMGGFVLAILSLFQTYYSIEQLSKTGVPWFNGLAAPMGGGYSPVLLKGAFVVDGFGLAVAFVALIAGAFTVLSSGHDEEDAALNSGEYYSLILLAVVGMMLLGFSHDFLTLLISLEVMSVSTYILAGSHRNELKSSEAAIKYLILGAFSTAFLMLGIAFIYGATGELTLSSGIVPQSSRLALAGISFLLVGVFFKIGAVPFHFWIPDVYEGAPPAITGLMAVGVKAAAFAVVARLCFETFGDTRMRESINLPEIITMFAILTMALGNLLAFQQNNLKRMLAYSGIAHTGYLMLAFLTRPGTSDPVLGQHAHAAYFYLISYALMTLGAFGVLNLRLENGKNPETFDDLKGLAKEHSGLALCMAVFMFSLSGLPPFAGFFAKFMVFRCAVDEGFYCPAVIGVLTSVVSLGYYLKVVLAMYMQTPADNALPHKCEDIWTSRLLIYVAGIGTLLLGVLPNLVYSLF